MTDPNNPKANNLTLHSLDREVAKVKAATLIESLAWLKRFRDQIIVIKFGGNAMVDEQLLKDFAADMVYLRYAGILPVVVHGGGPQISAELKRQGIATEFRAGFRYTTVEAIKVVTKVLTEQVRVELTDAINEHGELAKGTSGAESNIFIADPLKIWQDGVEIDLGRVGEISRVNTEVILHILQSGGIPVVSSIARGESGELLNVNADSAAAALAIACHAAKLMILTDVPGLYSDWPNQDSLISVIHTDELKKLLPSLESGMIPKMQACLDAVESGVPKAAIIDGREAHSVLLEIFTTEGVGTEVIELDVTA